jgi:hypothetical protein
MANPQPPISKALMNVADVEYWKEGGVWPIPTPSEPLAEPSRERPWANCEPESAKPCPVPGINSS